MDDIDSNNPFSYDLFTYPNPTNESADPPTIEETEYETDKTTDSGEGTTDSSAQPAAASDEHDSDPYNGLAAVLSTLIGIAQGTTEPWPTTLLSKPAEADVIRVLKEHKGVLDSIHLSERRVLKALRALKEEQEKDEKRKKADAEKIEKGFLALKIAELKAETKRLKKERDLEVKFTKRRNELEEMLEAERKKIENVEKEVKKKRAEIDAVEKKRTAIYNEVEEKRTAIDAEVEKKRGGIDAEIRRKRAEADDEMRGRMIDFENEMKEKRKAFEDEIRERREEWVRMFGRNEWEAEMGISLFRI